MQQSCGDNGHDECCKEPDYTAILGDTSAFLTRIFSEVSALGINVSTFLCDHVCFRVSTLEEYEAKKAQLLKVGELLNEEIIGTRPICTFLLHKPIIFRSNFGVEYSVPCVELPAPKNGSPYRSGLEHVEFAIGYPSDSYNANSKLDPSTDPIAIISTWSQDLQRDYIALTRPVFSPFLTQYPSITWDMSSSTKHYNADVSLAFPHCFMSVKFHHLPLRRVVQLEKYIQTH